MKVETPAVSTLSGFKDSREEEDENKIILCEKEIAYVSPIPTLKMIYTNTHTYGFCWN